jgi:hypothetical protein
MRSYVKVKSVRTNQVDAYLAQGWEIIETTKEWTGHSADDTILNYHIGLTAMILLEKYQAIVKDYERFGFKEKLFESIANENGKTLDDYEQSGWNPNKDEVSEYMTNYEIVTDGDTTPYGVVSKTKESAEFDVTDKDIDF